ncbi:hypothetical protein Tsubulata_033732 [Turnera subulata]|uniref:CCHC-type domain-containing protein n=1 Tax=Turnera subulata TaxID=218843 RepID=A0A9Q0GER8_9ROSI|nr:hypothetical protein Tsubulata_033732 [Turnera subulata]
MEVGSSSRGQGGAGYQQRSLKLTRNAEQGKCFSEHTLVGRVIALKPTQCYLLNSLAPRIWGLKHALEVKEVGKNTFLFSFQKSEERNRVLKGGQWIFLGSLLIVKEWNSLVPMQELELNKAVFWVHVNAPLCDGFNDADEKGKARWISLSYEKLPDHCFSCGKLGHMMKHCPEEGEKVIRFGINLRAEPDFHKRRAKDWERIAGPWMEKEEPSKGKKTEEMVARLQKRVEKERQLLDSPEEPKEDPDIHKTRLVAFLRAANTDERKLAEICNILKVQIPDKGDAINVLRPLFSMTAEKGPDKGQDGQETDGESSQNESGLGNVTTTEVFEFLKERA